MALLKSLLAAVSALAGLMLASPVPPSPRSGPVTEAEWPALLAEGKASGVIDLGERTVVDLPRTLRSASVLTIRGGRFGPVVLDGWRNVTLDGGRFSAPAGVPEFQNLIVANDAQNLTIRNAHFSGYESPDGELRVRGTSIRGGRNVTVERSTFEHMGGFPSFIRTDGARFADNDLHDVREGLNVQGGRNIVIERNRFERFRPSPGDHADGVQFFTAGLTQPGDTGARDVTIRDNLILCGSKAQGVFIGDELELGRKGTGYARFVIEDNIILGAGWHGITVSYSDGLIVRNNHLGRFAGSDLYDSRIDVDGSAVQVDNNEANDFIYRGAVKETRNKKAGERPARAFDALVTDWVARFRKG